MRWLTCGVNCSGFYARTRPREHHPATPPPGILLRLRPAANTAFFVVLRAVPEVAAEEGTESQAAQPGVRRLRAVPWRNQGLAQHAAVPGVFGVPPKMEQELSVPVGETTAFIRNYLIETVRARKLIDFESLVDAAVMADTSGLVLWSEVRAVLQEMIDRAEVVRVGDSVQLPW